jgi:predicted acylesterase/phospholipase RssA
VNRTAKIGLLVVAAFLIQACASAPERLEAVPAELTDRAVIPGMAGVRYVAGGDMSELVTIATDSVRKETAYRASQGQTGPLPPAAYLAISGGGDKGAYTAGLLNGWTAAGTRPEFKLVTGISTGALIAPFAFLGQKYDATLTEVYTTIGPEDVLEQRSLLGGLLSDAMADNAPLWELTRKFVTQELLQEVAAEYAKGRFLMIGTADIDARRPIMWDMGRIASYGGPEALELFINVMMASTSIPVGFPPVMIDVEVDGKGYQEMHVDGGTMSQVFAYPSAIRVRDLSVAAGFERERNLYIIRNARLDPDWAQVERKTMSIGGRAISSLIHTQGIGDLFRIYATAERDGVDFNLAFIPPTFTTPHPEEFDNAYMRALYKVGYDLAIQGFPWIKAPPNFDPIE